MSCGCLDCQNYDHCPTSEIEVLNEEIAKLKNALKVAKEALEFYADKKNQIAPDYTDATGTKPGADFTAPYRMDKGLMATKAIQEISRIEGEK